MRSIIVVMLLLAMMAVAQVHAGAAPTGCSGLSGNLLSACRNCNGDAGCESCVAGVDASGLNNPINTASRCQGRPPTTQACIVSVANSAGGSDPIVFVDRCNNIACPAQAECLADAAASGGSANAADACLSEACEPVPPFGSDFNVCKFFGLSCRLCRNTPGADEELCISCFQGAYSAVFPIFRLAALRRAAPTCLSLP